LNDLAESRETREAIRSVAHYAGLRLPERPRLAPWIRIVDLGDDRLQLRSAESSHTLSHPLLAQIFRRIMPLLDGDHTLEEIVAVVDSDVLPTTVHFVLKLLQGKGLLQPGVGEGALGEKEQARWQKQIQFLSHFVPDASRVQSVLQKARVGLAGSGALRQSILAAMEAVGLGEIAALPEPDAGRGHPSLDIIVACADSPAFTFFDAVNRACLASGTRWLRVCLAGTSAELGPTIIPRQTACYMCLDLRLRTHQPDPDAYLAYRTQSDRHGDEGFIAPFLSAVAGQVTLEVIRLLTGLAPAVTVGRFYQLGAASPVATPHDVLKVPRCPCCGRRRTTAEAWDQNLAGMDSDK